jgi:hypothetical protein
MAGARVAEGRANAGRALSEAFRVLRPGGRVWISELIVSRGVYRVQEAAAALTRFLLGLLNQPFVSFHTAAFYVDRLGQSGFVGARMESIEVPAAGNFDLITPIIAAPWLRVPRFVYPLHVALATASKATEPDLRGAAHSL